MSTRGRSEKAKLDAEAETVMVVTTEGDDIAIDKPKAKSTKIVGAKVPVQMRGKTVDGRTWKTEKKRFSAVNKRIGTSNGPSFEERREKEAKMKALKQKERDMKALKEEEHRQTVEKMRERRKRREENSMKNVKYDIVTNTSKLKKMSKKQLSGFRKLADVNK